mgnify:CR=1 FL=1
MSNPVRFAAAVAAAALLSPALAHAGTVGDCHVGAYRLADRSLVDIGPTDGDAFRWRRFDGSTGALHRQADGTWSSTYGWTDRSDGRSVDFSACPSQQIVFDKLTGQRIDFQVTETSFVGRDGTKLLGRLVLPKGKGPVPIVVLVHGAERDSARDFYSLQRMLPAEGVGAFVYDKRGTGASAGTYTQDFEVLANDAVAAMRVC